MGFLKVHVTGLYLKPIMRAVTRPLHPKDGFMIAREAILIKLLSYCADNCVFFDAKQFSRLTALPLKQCEVVWELCIKNNVLREHDGGDGGYSAIGWLNDNNLIGDVECACKPEKEGGFEKTCKDTDDGGNGEIEANGCEESTHPDGETNIKEKKTKTNENSTEESHNIDLKNEHTPPPNEPCPIKSREVKIAVRPNVYLSNSEIQTLREQFTDEQISLMVDKLSDYKSQTNRYYKSDYQAITRWVVKWMNDSLASKQNESNDKNVTNQFPDWITEL